MKRLLVCSAVLAGGLVALSAQAQQPPQQPNPGPANPQVQPGQAPPNAQPNVRPNAQPNAQPDVRPNVRPNTQPNTQPNRQPDTQPNVQPNAQGNTTKNTQQFRGTGTEFRGQVVRAANGEIVVRGSDNKERTFHTNPQTRYWHKNEAGRWDDIRVGSTINAWYGPAENDRYFANGVEVIPVEGAVQPNPAPTETYYEGQVVRVVGKDQVIIRTSDNKEIAVYVNPQTTYRFNEQPGTFTTLQPGVPIRVDYYMKGDRPHARGILGVRNR